MEALAPQERWSTGRKFTILFFTIYFAFLIFDFTSSDELFLHVIYLLLSPLTKFWNWIVPWTGANILHLKEPITILPNGSGDTTYNWVLQLLWLVFALVISLAWLVLDRKRPAYNDLYYWLRIILRYWLAYMLFVYGFIKVIKLQFPAPNLIRLLQPYGDSSPMGLAWTFIGYSKMYNLFSGGAEVLAGALLFFRRTTLLGALMAMAVMINVAALNFSYDIPVKIFSLNLVIMSAFIASADWVRIRNVFFLNRPAPAAFTYMPHPTRWKRRLKLTLKIFAIFFALFSTFWSSFNSRNYGDDAPKTPLYGIYNVQSFLLNNDTIAPMMTDTTRWKQVVINYEQSLRITTMPDSLRWMRMKMDTLARTINLFNLDSTITCSFQYSKPDSLHLNLRGRIGNDSAFITMTRFDEKSFRLLKRGFHWINERPYNY